MRCREVASSPREPTGGGCWLGRNGAESRRYIGSVRVPYRSPHEDEGRGEGNVELCKLASESARQFPETSFGNREDEIWSRVAASEFGG